MSLNKGTVAAKIDDISQELKELAMRIHDNPELGFNETMACSLHSDLLRKHGFDVKVGITDFPTAFKAVYDSGKAGPTIAFLAEYDALPNIGHGCGHNLVGAVSTGAGISSCQIADEFGGRIIVFGTPAEENGGTKAVMTDQGVFDECDVILMAHPAYSNVDSMNTLALSTMTAEFFGRASHASGAPEVGINALDAVINMFNMVNAMRQQIRSDARIHGIIENGGVVPNIIPDYTKCSFYVRASDSKYCDELYEKLKKIAEAAALGTGCTFRISKYHHDLDATKQNMVLSDLVTKNMESFGQKVRRMDRVAMPVSSDIGNVTHICPSIQMCFCIGRPDSGNVIEAHTLGFARDAGSEDGLNGMIRAAKVLSMTAYDILSDPDVYSAVRKDFESSE